MTRERRVYRLVFLLVLAPLGAVVIAAALLLFGLKPHTVFLAGHAFKSVLSTYGFRSPNAVGVIATVLLWWAVIAIAGLAWENYRRNRAT